MKHVVTKWLAILLLLPLFIPSAFASETVSSVTLNQVQQRNDELTMYLNMSDASGYPCTGDYRSDQFSVSMDGKTISVDSIQTFDAQTQGIHYVFSVDVSTSLTQDMIDNMKSATLDFTNALTPLDSVSIITFGEDVKVLLSHCSDKAEISACIDSILPCENMTALYKGVIDAVDLAASTSDRSVVVVITDGKNDPTAAMQGYTEESIFNQVQRAQVPLYCFGLNDANGVDLASLLELAEVSGGGQFGIVSGQISERLSFVCDKIRSALVLKATLVNEEEKSGFDETSTFQVGFQPDYGSFIISNELQQAINWNGVPGPFVLPKLSLELDEEAMDRDENGSVTLTGAIDVEEGTVEPEELSLTVNGDTWQFDSIMRNGTGFTFSARGTPTPEADVLEVRAEIISQTVASRIQRVSVGNARTSMTPRPEVTPPVTAVPTQSPAVKEPEVTAEATVPTEKAKSPVVYTLGAGAVLICAAVAVVIGMSKKKKREAQPLPENYTAFTSQRFAEMEGYETVFGPDTDATLYGEETDERLDPDVFEIGDITGRASFSGTDGCAADPTVYLDVDGNETIQLDDDVTKGLVEDLDGETPVPPSLDLDIEEERLGAKRFHGLVLREGEEKVIGRSADADITIDDMAVSSRHLLIGFDGQMLYGLDLGSTNGTKVNDESVEKGIRLYFSSGDEIRIGKSTLHLHFEKW